LIVVDTTVLVYAVGGDHSLAAPCRQLLERVRDGKLTATTTAEVVQEFVHVRARRRGRADAAALGRDFALLLAPLLPVGDDELGRGLDLYARSEALGAFDCVLAAAALAARADAFVSADRAFAEVPGLAHVDPATPPFQALLGSG
jgi:predicted nucleic acid-binding protein